MVIIIKHKEDFTKQEEEIKYFAENILRLKYCDGVFYRCEENEYIKKDTEFKQDKHLIIHDVIADLFYKQLNNKNYAYTSTSSLGGHHNMDENGTLIFLQGEPFYIWGGESNIFNFEVY